MATNTGTILKYIPLIFILLAAGALTGWLLVDPASSIQPAVPGMDHRPESSSVRAEQVIICEFFELRGTAEPVPGTNWPSFRGPGRDNISKEPVKLLDSWGEKAPVILWKVDLGEGHAAPAVSEGKVYLMDYDEIRKADALRCFSLKTGQELWRRWYPVHLKRNHGLSRTVPAVGRNTVVTIGPRCHVMCVDRNTGNFRWGIDLEKQYGTEAPFWYTGQCPLLINDTAVVAVGGKVLMIGVDCNTGTVVWEAPNPDRWTMSHSSVMPMSVDGKKFYVYCAIGGICGISADGPDQGSILWKTTEFAPSVVAPSPVILDGGRFFVSAGYGYGGALFRVKKNGSDWIVKILQNYKPSQGLASEQQTPIYAGGNLYGIMPKDAGELRNEFVCFHPGDLKKATMHSGKTNRFGLGPYILADGKFFILSDDGELTIAECSPTRFKILDRKRIIEGQDSWGPIAITGGYLLMRDSKQLVCLDIKAK